jgi:Multiubiquitin
MTSNEGHKDQEHGQNKETLIYVNTKPITWTKVKISFEDLVNIAFPGAQNHEFDITYARGQSDQEGELLNGQSVPVHHKMEFIVTPTNES